MARKRPSSRQPTLFSSDIGDATEPQETKISTSDGKLLKTNGALTAKRLFALIGLRDRARRVLQSQNEGWPEANRIEARAELNRAYDRFVTSYGPINKTTFSE